MSEGDSAKSAITSKTVHFNLWTAAVWPFLPKHFREDPMAPQVILAWFAIGNLILRFLTKTAVRLYIRREVKDASKS